MSLKTNAASLGLTDVHAKDMAKALRVMGYEDIREFQVPLMKEIFTGNDVIGVLPTGAGKSAAFILPGLVRGHRTLVISPLISLQTDQVSKLTAAGLKAAAVNSTGTAADNKEHLDNWSKGKLQFLYIAPERLATNKGMDMIMKQHPDTIVVDETHCVSEWGDSFRPAYRKVAELVKLLHDNAQVIALSATLTPYAEAGVRRILELPETTNRIEVQYARNNLTYRTFIGGDIYDLSSLCQTNDPTVVFCCTTVKVDEVARQLKARLGKEVCSYHGKLTASVKKRMQSRFMKGTCNIIVATNAFGMGVDKANIRQVIHYDMPGSLSSYAQESGRAGRDGKPAKCILFYDQDIKKTHRWFIGNGNPSMESLKRIWKKLARDSKGGKEGVSMLAESLAKAGGLQLGAADTARNILIGAKMVIAPESNAMDVVRLKKQPPRSMRAHASAYEALRTIAAEDGVKRGGKITMPARQMMTSLKQPMVSQMRSLLIFMRDRGAIDYIPATNKYTVDTSKDIDKAIDWTILEARREQDFTALEDMLTFVHVSDATKADIISNYFKTGEVK